jgi:hypothetical protein
MFVAAILMCMLSALTAVYVLWVYRNNEMLAASKMFLRCVLLILDLLVGIVVFGKSVMFLVEFTQM